jgi:hypothetical protein
MDLRDKFAMAALNGLCANSEEDDAVIPLPVALAGKDAKECAKYLAIQSYLLADAMMMQRGKASKFKISEWST